LALWVFASGPAAAAARSPVGARMLQAGASRPRSHWVIWVIWVTVLNCKLAPVAIVIWVIWVICFLLTQMTQKAQIWRPGNSPALGHLGHFVTLQKLARVESST
jgi:hypothetical protein